MTNPYNQVQIEEVSDMCTVCGQTPCNCTHIEEEVEQVNELSSELLARYKKKASTQASAQDKEAFSQGTSQSRARALLDKSHKRYKGIIKATGKQFANDVKEETDHDPDEYKRYHKIFHDAWHHGYMNSKGGQTAVNTSAGVARAYQHSDKAPLSHRRALEKARTDVVMSKGAALKEETEQIDEISKKVLGSYVKAAHSDIVDRASSSSFVSGAKGDKYNKAEDSAKEMKRSKGIAAALGRLTKEEVEQIDELSTLTLHKYVKKRWDKEKTRDLRWKDDDHPDVKAHRKSLQNIRKAEDKMRANRPADRKAEDERNKKYHEAKKPEYKKEAESVKKEYEAHHGPIEKGGHEYAAYKGYRHGQELHQRYHNLKKLIGEEKDYSKPIAKLKDIIAGLKKDVSTVSKGHAKMEKKEKKEEEKAKIDKIKGQAQDKIDKAKGNDPVTPEDHQAALNHFSTQYRMAKMAGDTDRANSHAKNYHDYSDKLNQVYVKKLKSIK